MRFRKTGSEAVSSDQEEVFEKTTVSLPIRNRGWIVNEKRRVIVFLLVGSRGILL
jgi:hypothetical protein